MRAADSDCIMSDGETQRCPQAFKKAQVMQIQALLLLSLFALGNGPQSQALQEADPDGSVSYLLTYDQDITYTALQTKCHNLNCTRIIYGIINTLVVNRDPTAVSTLSDDPVLSSQNTNQQDWWAFLCTASLAPESLVARVWRR